MLRWVWVGVFDHLVLNSSWWWLVKWWHMAAYIGCGLDTVGLDLFVVGDSFLVLSSESFRQQDRRHGLARKSLFILLGSSNCRSLCLLLCWGEE